MNRLLNSLLALLALTLLCDAAPVKIVSWNLEPEAGAAPPPEIKELVAPLKQASPDIILLQAVSDWDFCTRLVVALKPAEYRIAVCTAFTPDKASPKPAQLAILSLHKAYSSWSEPWTNNLSGGFAFAAFLIAEQRVGVFSLSMDPAASLDRRTATELRGTAARQALGQFQVVQAWKSNQPRLMLAGGTFRPEDPNSDEALNAFNTAGFRDSLGSLSGSERLTTQASAGHEAASADTLLLWPAEKLAPGRVSRTGKALHFPVSVEVPFETKPAARPAVTTTNRPATKKEPSITNAASRGLPPTNRASVEARPTAEPANDASSTNKAARAPELVPLLKPSGEVIDNLAEESSKEPSAGRRARNQQVLWGLLATISISFFGICALVLRKRAQRWTALQPLLLAEKNSRGSAYTIVNTRSMTGSDAVFPQELRIEQPGDSQTLSRALLAPSGKPAPSGDELLRAGLAAHLSQWLKQKFVHRLLTDREQMLQAQNVATVKSLEAQQALSRLESRIQQQNAVYQARIDALSRELSATREENRELIRARIAEAREEMAAARERILGRGGRD